MRLGTKCLSFCSCWCLFCLSSSFHDHWTPSGVAHTLRSACTRTLPCLPPVTVVPVFIVARRFRARLVLCWRQWCTFRVVSRSSPSSQLTVSTPLVVIANFHAGRDSFASVDIFARAKAAGSSCICSSDPTPIIFRSGDKYCIIIINVRSPTLSVFTSYYKI